MTHQDVVDKLRMDRSPLIQLTVDRARPPREKEQTITVSLEKNLNTSLGLSLAKRMGHEGVNKINFDSSRHRKFQVYIRNISAGSVADKDGHLRVGDKIWEVDGENVSEEGANAIVERLKSVEGRQVEIVVKRAVE